MALLIVPSVLATRSIREWPGAMPKNVGLHQMRPDITLKHGWIFHPQLEVMLKWLLHALLNISDLFLFLLHVIMQNMSKRSVYDKRYYEKNKDKIKQRKAVYNKLYREKNRDKLNESCRSYYRDNCERETAKKNDYRNKKKQIVEGLKSSKGCKICGEKHPAVLDFHHRDKNNKVFSVSDGIKLFGFSLSKILLEIEKCDVICSNCHRKLHWEEKQW